ncbi:MAG: AMMECR1 domain-containing protein [Armatimonadota bacterium]|nr:AMMECR1 domain-containing protein [Armatimonadota bacterium]
MQKQTALFVSLILILLAGAPQATHAEQATFERWRQADPQTQAFALALARRAFDAYILRREVIEPPKTMPALFQSRVAVFVSAMRFGAPRCCMGTLYPTQPNAAEEIIANAVAAAGRDHRFPPIPPEKRKQLTLIVSVLSPPVPLSASGLASLDPTRDGLVVQNGDRSGVVLSGETGTVANMVQWGRTRAGAKANSAVQFFRIQSVRFVEARNAGGIKPPATQNSRPSDGGTCDIRFFLRPKDARSSLPVVLHPRRLTP